VLNPRAVFAADINSDGNIDVLSASSADKKIAWYKNMDGLGNFGEQQIIDISLEALRTVYTSDLDGDGDQDILSTSRSDNLVVWFKNIDGLGNFSSQILITENAMGARSVYSTDLDGDEDMDVLSASFEDNKIAWYENLDGLGNFGSQQIITSSALSVRSVFAADIDGDGDMDVLCDSSDNGTGNPSWFENIDGLGNFSSQHEITQDTWGSIFTIAEDVDGDGDMDVLNVEFGANIIAWFENLDGLGNFGPKLIISIEVDAPRQIRAVDVDNDGDIDVISVSQGDDKIAWYENIDGLGNFAPQQIIAIDIGAAYSVYTADLDNDGDIDVMSASISADTIAWYENLTILGVKDNNLKEFVFYPNPVSSILNIENNSNYIINSIKFYNVLGSLVYQVENPKQQINVSNLASGLLFAQLDTNKGMITKKIIKE